jgi:diaminohydroxyphosphoribosylaminopyrimidine deaminase / 5-amino-6-(5-phosphoribosylamino)uracil reductase
MTTEADKQFMAQALELAGRGLNTTPPNPRVGCVIVREETVVGAGWHERAGGPHAEVNALAEAGERARGATAYVTLEPCHHHGRTPPCDEALVRAGLVRVVAAMQDPNPLVAGGGLARLRAAGIAVEAGVLEREARELNIGFVSRFERGRPWVRMKIAASVDGRIALNNGASRWITGEEARNDGQRWRARACAVLTGIGTVRADDPQMNVRAIATPRQPLRVVLDSRFETPLSARIFEDGGVLIVGAVDDQPRIRALRAKGAEVVVLPAQSDRLDLNALMTELARREINEVHVEAGARLNGALLSAGCVDELLLYYGARLVGDRAIAMAAMPELTDLGDARALVISDVRMVGRDVRMLARIQ